MSLLWKIEIEREEGDQLLFTKLSQTDVRCNECQQVVKQSNYGTSNLKKHLAKHPVHLKKLEDAEKYEETNKKAMQKGLAKFVVRGEGDLSSLDRRIMHFIAFTNQSFALVEKETFKVLFSENLKGRQHFADWVMPRVYAAVKKEIVFCASMIVKHSLSHLIYGRVQQRISSDFHSPPTKRSESFFGRHSHMFSDEGQTEEQVSSAMVEMMAYKKQRHIDPDNDPLNFRKESDKVYPILAELARRFLSAPARSQPSERLFSVARDVYDYKRSGLDPETAERLIFQIFRC